MASFAKRQLEFTIKLASAPKTNQPASFAESGTDTVTIPRGLRSSVRIQNSGAPSGSRARAQVWGIQPSLMNQLATLGMVYNLIPRNTITIAAGDEGKSLSPVFTGTIMAAYADYDAMPDVPFYFECLSGLAEALAPARPSSFPRATDAQTVMAGLARQMGLIFENNNVNVPLPTSYFDGNYTDQFEACRKAANIEGVIAGGKLIIWPKGGSRNTPTIPMISKATGMIGSPAFTQQGIIVRTVFDPLISFGGLIKVQSFVLDGTLTAQKNQNATFKVPTDSTWAVNKLDLALDCLVPKGQWMSSIQAYNPNYPKPLPQQGAR